MSLADVLGRSNGRIIASLIFASITIILLSTRGPHPALHANVTSKVWTSLNAPFRQSKWMGNDKTFTNYAWDRWAQGRWSDGVANYSDTLHSQWLTPPSYAPFPIYTQKQLASCLTDKWIMIIGDSSSRLLYASWIGRTDPDAMKFPFMPQYNRDRGQPPDDTRRFEQYLKGNIEAEIPSNEDAYYFREHMIPSTHTRISFCFKRDADDSPLYISQLLSTVNQPDLIILNTGPWDGYHGHTAAKASEDFTAYLSNLKSVLGLQSTTALAYVNVLTQHPGFTEFGDSFNELTAATMQNLSIPVFQRNLTRPPSNNDYVEGWHAWGKHTELLLDGLFSGICSM